MSSIPETTPETPSRKAPTTVPYKDWTWQWSIPALCISLGTVGLRLVHDTSFWSFSVRGIEAPLVVGSLSQIQGGVRSKPFRSFIWHDLGTADRPANAGDTIFTGEDGSLSLRFSDGNSARILSNSLIVIQRPGYPKAAVSNGSWLSHILKPAIGWHPPMPLTSPVIEVKQGNVQLSVKPGTTPMEVFLNEKAFRFSPSSQAAEGAAEIAFDPTNASEPARIVVDSSSPVGLSELKAGGAESSIALKQQGQTEVAIGARGQVRTRAVLLKPISPQNGEAVLPQAAAGQAGSKTKGPGTVPVRFEWDVPNEDRVRGKVELEIEGPESRKIAVPLKSRTLDIALKGGNYRWRLVLEEEGSVAQHKTPWVLFSIVGLTPPKILGPVSEAVVPAEAEGKTWVTFTWDPVPSPLRAEMEILPENAPSERTSVDGSESGAKLELEPGHYLWRVRSASPEGETSPWASWHRVKLKARAPTAAQAEGSEASEVASVLAQPRSAFTESALSGIRAETASAPAIQVPEPAEADSSVRAPSVVETLPVTDGVAASGKKFNPADGMPLLLQWKPIPGAVRYQVSVFTNTGGAYKDETVDQPRLTILVKSLEETNYLYRVTAILGNGQKIASQAVPISLQLQAPKPGRPVAGAEVPTQKALLMSWEQTSMTLQYQIQISKDEKFGEIVSDQTVKKNWFNFTPKAAGKYYWRVRGLRQGKQSDWGPGAAFTAK